MDRIRVQILVMGLVALAIGVGPGDVRGMIVLAEQDSGCPTSLALPNAIATCSAGVAGGAADAAPSTSSGPFVLSFAGTAAGSPSAERLSQEIIVTHVLNGMVPSGDSISQAGGYGMGAAVAATIEIVPEDLLPATLGCEYLVDWPVGPASRLFRPPRV